MFELLTTWVRQVSTLTVCLVCVFFIFILNWFTTQHLQQLWYRLWWFRQVWTYHTRQTIPIFCCTWIFRNCFLVYILLIRLFFPSVLFFCTCFVLLYVLCYLLRLSHVVPCWSIWFGTNHILSKTLKHMKFLTVTTWKFVPWAYLYNVILDFPHWTR